MKSLKMIADELEVKKQEVYRCVKRNCFTEVPQEALPEALQKNGTKYYDDETVRRIKEDILAKKAPPDDDEAAKLVLTKEQVELLKNMGLFHDEAQAERKEMLQNEVIEMLRTELEVKNQQILSLQEQNGQLTEALAQISNSLQAAQALHAGTLQQLGSADPPEAELAAERPRGFRRWFGRQKT